MAAWHEDPVFKVDNVKGEWTRPVQAKSNEPRSSSVSPTAWVGRW